jgi:hypothetical protein
VTPNLKYAGEAVFFLGIAFRLMRWIWSAVSEGDAPPSAYPTMPAMGIAARPAGTAERIAGTLMSEPALLGDDRPNTWLRVATPDAPPQPGDPGLFPPEMLAAMTPEERERVLQTLAKQRTASGHS